MRTADFINYLVADTALGVALIAASSRGICAVEFGDRASDLVAALEGRYQGARCQPADSGTTSPEVARWLAEVRLALQGPRDGVDGVPPVVTRPLDIPLDQAGTAFQRAVWQQLRAIPAGRVVSYRDLAEAIGAPRSVRAVGSACGANRLALLVPCHRALRQDGGLGGYRWGLARKARLLDWERAAQ